ncbi:hypothetical protein [Reichenbachiella ulvae]|uniref:ABC-2 family transporter protein n=1 Tax=Reichenbachiella ulvae TaxID=2980104 RepID=A0ABT3CRG9_9BACT|nr:hypothetical protein [Reichenbachiella ulvae]MCV9386306.1 hypothetical protein [Reichenbachiella ulvae]
MNRLIKLEWIKNKSNLTFWILLLVYLGAVFVILSSGKILMNATYEFTSNQEIQEIPQITIYDFPGIWHNLSYIGSFVRILLAIVMVVNISNEISFRTIRQNIIDGLSKEHFLASKLIWAFALSSVATLAFIGITLYFGFQYSPSKTSEVILSNLDFIGAYFIEVFGYLCFAMMVTFWIKKSGLSIMFILAYSILFENFIGWVFLDSEGFLIKLLPINALDNLIRIPMNFLDPESVQKTVEITEPSIALGWTAGFIFLSYLLLKNRDV